MCIKHLTTQHILSKVNSDIVQTWSFRPFETANKDQNISLTTGTFVDESMFKFSGGKDSWGKGNINHMTVEQNKQWADKIFEAMHE